MLPSHAAGFDDSNERVRAPTRMAATVTHGNSTATIGTEAATSMITNIRVIKAYSTTGRA
jgi:hypothetical protein